MGEAPRILNAQLVTRFIRFLVVGGLNTVFGYAVFALLLWVGLPLELALLLAGIIGVLFNFITYGRLAFGEELNRKALARFIATYAIAYVVNVLLARWLISFGLSAYAAQLCLLPIMAGGTFIALRYFVYR